MSLEPIDASAPAPVPAFDDDLYPEAVKVVINDQKPSTSYLQRRLQIGYNRAAALMEQMERHGLVGPADHAGKRLVLSKADISAVLASLSAVTVSPSTIDTAFQNPDVLTTAAQSRLRSIIERIERLDEDKAAIAADIKEVFGEAKGEGYDVKTLRKVVRIRKQDKAKRQEEEAILDLYLSAIGEV